MTRHGSADPGIALRNLSPVEGRLSSHAANTALRISQELGGGTRHLCLVRFFLTQSGRDGRQRGHRRQLLSPGDSLAERSIDVAGEPPTQVDSIAIRQVRQIFLT
jgi:hypothetical protein